jgi:hypothetical protein
MSGRERVDQLSSALFRGAGADTIAPAVVPAMAIVAATAPAVVEPPASSPAAEGNAEPPQREIAPPAVRQRAARASQSAPTAASIKPEPAKASPERRVVLLLTDETEEVLRGVGEAHRVAEGVLLNKSQIVRAVLLGLKLADAVTWAGEQASERRLAEAIAAKLRAPSGPRSS